MIVTEQRELLIECYQFRQCSNGAMLLDAIILEGAKHAGKYNFQINGIGAHVPARCEADALVHTADPQSVFSVIEAVVTVGETDKLCTLCRFDVLQDGLVIEEAPHLREREPSSV